MVVTARKRSLRRLCFYTCVSVHGGVPGPGRVPGPRLGCLVPGGFWSWGEGGVWSWGGGGCLVRGVVEIIPLGMATAAAGYWNAFLVSHVFIHETEK